MPDLELGKSVFKSTLTGADSQIFTVSMQDLVLNHLQKQNDDALLKGFLDNYMKYVWLINKH